MVRADLLGRHSHQAASGERVHVWKRNDTYLARGRYHGRRYGQTLGNSVLDAEASLRRVLVAIENRSFVVPSQARQLPLRNGSVPRLTLREVINAFLAEKRKLRGKDTANTYRSRLSPVLEFAEQATNRQLWPFASSIDRQFAVALRQYLHRAQTTRNGRTNSNPKPMSARQIYNVLDTLRGVFNWAHSAAIRFIPGDWINPLTEDIVGQPPRKDPLREVKLPIDHRIKLVRRMNRWQLCQLSLSLVLPMRPDEAAGLLVSDVNLDGQYLSFGTRLGGGDFTKGHTSFRVPFPAELLCIIKTCIASRSEGPLLRNQKAFAGLISGSQVASHHELCELFARRLADAPSESVQNENDRKHLFRTLLLELGGVTSDVLGKQFGMLAAPLHLGNVSLKDARSAISTEMGRAGVRFLELRYLTSHRTNDIMNHYVSLEPAREMAKYFAAIKPLLAALRERCDELGIGS
jgi:integrase